MDRRGSGDGTGRLAFVPEGSEAARSMEEAEDRGLMAVLPANSHAAMQAFARQTVPGRRTAAGPLRAGARDDRVHGWRPCRQRSRRHDAPVPPLWERVAAPGRRW